MIRFLEGLLDLAEPPQEFVTVKGDFSFFLDPVIKGVVPYHTCSIVITCYENGHKKDFVDFEIKWYKIIGSDTYEYKDYTEKYYHCNASDAPPTSRSARCSWTRSSSPRSRACC